jgi:hypothetical protein
MTRLQHVPALALERKLAYTNDQWSMPGAQLLTVRYRDRAATLRARSVADRHRHPMPARMVAPGRGRWRFPRDAFDYVWLIRPPAV